MTKSKVDSGKEVPPEAVPQEPKTYDLSDPKNLFEVFGDLSDPKAVAAVIRDRTTAIIKSHGLDSYLVLFLYDDRDPISSYHANKLYQAASRGDRKKDILLIVESNGGSIEPAYLISKTCKRLAKDRFIVAVPRRAKSAATLLSLGADEIHMGLMSELGPIDPQIGGYPSLSLANALNVLADLACRFPGSGEMFAQYLTKNLDLKDLGYFQRVGESASQYAERLLSGKSLGTGYTPASLADHFVNHYKEHGFVIDLDEAVSLLGPEVVKHSSPEYRAANELYDLLDFASFLYGVVHKSHFDLVGDSEATLTVRKKRVDG